jgi:hypothetical protein
MVERLRFRADEAIYQLAAIVESSDDAIISAETLVVRRSTLDEELRRDLIQRIATAGLRLDHLISDLLEFTRLERGQLRIELGPRELAPLVGQTLERLGSVLDTHPIELEVPPGLAVVADETALSRILENLLTNASKFAEAGTPIRIAAERNGRGSVVLSIIDRGTGIPTDQLDRIFERFYRAGDSHRRLRPSATGTSPADASPARRGSQPNARGRESLPRAPLYLGRGRIRAALAVAVPARLLRREAEADGGKAYDQMREPDVRRLVGEAEDPRRRRAQGARADVDELEDP